MNYEIAVLAALVQLDKPTGPKITEKTGISTRRVNTAIRNLKEILGLDISWRGPNKTGSYSINSWGTFESGKNIRRKALAFDLSAYRSNKSIKYDANRLKKIYSEEVKLDNYRQSLRLEGFQARPTPVDLSALSKNERQQLRAQMKKKFARQSPLPITGFNQSNG